MIVVTLVLSLVEMSSFVMMSILKTTIDVDSKHFICIRII